MRVKEYGYEKGAPVHRHRLCSAFLDQDTFSKAHQYLPILTQDVFIKKDGGVILLRRNNEPANGELWPVGGRVKKGVSLDASMESRARQECNLGIMNLELIGVARHYFQADPFGHGKGTDTPCLVYVADGFGKIQTDNLHSGATIVTPEMFDNMKYKLHPYVRDNLEEILV